MALIYFDRDLEFGLRSINNSIIGLRSFRLKLIVLVIMGSAAVPFQNALNCTMHILEFVFRDEEKLYERL